MTSPHRLIARWVSFVVLLAALVLPHLASAIPPIPPHFRVNVGGTDTEGSPRWSGDTRSVPSPYLTGGQNATASTVQPIALNHPSVPAGTPQSLFQTRRWDPETPGNMTWAFPADPGKWKIRLYFAESNPNAWAVGERVFDVGIEGSAALTDLDIFALAGPNRGLVKELTVTTDNVIDIVFEPGQRRPIVSGIELIDLDGDPVDPDPDPVGCAAGIPIQSGGNIQAAIDSKPAGTTFCLTGHYTLTRPLYPRSGQRFIGPATIASGGADTAFQLKSGASGNAGATGVLIDELEIVGFSERAVDCWVGTVIRNSRIHHNGRNGIGCGLEGLGGVLIENNDVFRNGNPNEVGVGSGGIKIANGDGVTIRGNRVFENIGNGVWCDIDCGRFEVLDNRIWGNTRKGVMYEISRGPALIAGNVVTDNNCVPSIWGEGRPECDLNNGSFGPQSAGSPGGGIAVNSSRNVTIRGNTLGGNMVAGINFRDDGRAYNPPFGIVVQDNNLAGDELLRCGEWGIVCSGNR